MQMLWCAEMITTVYPVATQWQLALEIGSNETLVNVRPPSVKMGPAGGHA